MSDHAHPLPTKESPMPLETRVEKATPGPWFWALDSRNQRTSLMRSGSGDYVVSPQADVGDYGLSVDRWNDVSEADARLIASAPTLLAALKEAADEVEELRRYANNHGAMIEDEFCDYAREAIALATSVPQ